MSSEKICCGCGKKLGLFNGKTKLSDGAYVCTSCRGKAIYTNLNLYSVHFEESMTAENYQDFVQLREDNRELVEDFHETHKFFDVIHIDSTQNQIIILDNATFKNRKKLLEENPTVFSAADLAYWCTNQGKAKDTTTFGNSKAEAEVYTILGFESPIYNPIDITTGKIKAESGIIFDSIVRDPKIAELHNVLEVMKEAECSARLERGEHAPGASLDSALKMMHIFKVKGYLTPKDIKTALKDTFDGDRTAIKEAKKQYDL